MNRVKNVRVPSNPSPRRGVCVGIAIGGLLGGVGLLARGVTATAASPKPVPRVQAVPQPRGEVSIECDSRELVRLHHGDGLRRPFLYPLVGPAGLSLTRLGHPHDPVSHSHHNSVWLSHAAVNGIDFWSDHPPAAKGRITDAVVTRLEAGCFRRPARWVDYAGPVTDDTVEGVALFDHPGNPGHPVAFHVRDDGWMGACLSHGRPIELARGDTLRVRYGVWVHVGMPPADAVEARWREFSERPLPAAAK
jgi:hypothetical protein